VRSGDHCHTLAEGDATPGEDTRTSEFVLDTAAPVTTCSTPPFGQVFDTDDVAVAGFSISDGALGSGIASSSATLDGYLAESGQTPIASGGTLDMYQLWPGTRTVAVSATDNLGNGTTSSCTFTIVPTTESILGNLERAGSDGMIRNAGLQNSLEAKLRAAAAAAERGQCHTENNILNAFLSHMQAQRGRGVDAGVADRLMAYVRDLLTRGDPRCGAGAARGPAGEKAN
jgi:hypothetical protein